MELGRGAEVQVQRCRGAGAGVDVHRCRGAGAEVQRCRDAVAGGNVPIPDETKLKFNFQKFLNLIRR